MILTLMTSLCLLPFAAGGPRAVCQTQPIKVEEGEDAVLQCSLDPPVDLSANTLDFKRDDNKVVYAYRDGRDYLDPQMERYRGRTTLLHEALPGGVVNLTISSVKLSDNGTYEFFVPKLKVGCALHLIVEPRDQQNRTERRDSSMTVAPVEEEPEPADQDAAKNPADWKTILGVVVGVVVVVVVLLLLWKRDAIKRRCSQEPGGRRTALDVEMVTTTTQQTKADEGRRAAAHPVDFY